MDIRLLTASFPVAKRWKQPKCPSMGEQINKCDISVQWNMTQVWKGRISIFHCTQPSLECYSAFLFMEKQESGVDTKWRECLKKTDRVKKMLIHAWKWVNLSIGNMLGERSHTEKDTYCMVPYICNIKSRYINRDKTKLVVVHVWQQGKTEEKLMNVQEVSFGSHGNVLKREVVLVQHCEVTECPSIVEICSVNFISIN